MSKKILPLEVIKSAIREGNLGDDYQGKRLYLGVNSNMVDWLVAEVIFLHKELDIVMGACRKMSETHYKETEYGFEFGAAKVNRLCSNKKTGAATISVETPKIFANCGLQIYVTKTGKIRVFDVNGEWRPPR